MAKMPQLMRSIRNRPEIPVISQPRDLEAKLRGSCRSSTRDLKSRDDMNQIHQGSSQRPSRLRTSCTQILPMIEVGCNTVERLFPLKPQLTAPSRGRADTQIRNGRGQDPSRQSGM